MTRSIGRSRQLAALTLAGTALATCSWPAVTPAPPRALDRPATPVPTGLEHTGWIPVSTGEPIELAALSGRIAFDDFEDVFAMDVDGSDVVEVAADPAGPEFDGAWSPDGRSIVYRDSTRGINENDEIFVAAADGSERRNLTDHPANDWGPDWSPDGSTIAFNSDRGRGRPGGFLVDADGTNLGGPIRRTSIATRG